MTFRQLVFCFKEYTPSYLTLNMAEGTILLSHVLENSQQKKPPPGLLLQTCVKQRIDKGAIVRLEI